MALKTPAVSIGNLNTSSATTQRSQQQNRRDLESQGFLKALSLCSTYKVLVLPPPLGKRYQKKKNVSIETGVLCSGVRGFEFKLNEAASVVVKSRGPGATVAEILTPALYLLGQ